MISSVLFTGDAGGLKYIDDTMNETPRSAFNMCCSCAMPEEKYLQRDLAPIRRNPKI